MSEPSTKRPAADGQAYDVVTLVDELLARAVEADASDIHFEPTAKEMLIRYRLDGVLDTVERIPAALAENIVSRLKVLAGLLTYRNDIPQEGRLELPAGKVSDTRLAVFPTIRGQRAVVRLFYDDASLADLDRLGFTPEVAAALNDLCQANQGVLLLTGPSGSGKSTTLAAMLRRIAQRQEGKSVVTLEDPVERRIDGVTQIEITPHGTMTHPTALRSLLRQDPQVLMIGEIRDAATARIVIDAGLTGHLLMSTLHSGTPAGAILRLLEMGIEPYQITSSISAVVNQRLVRRLCENCKTAAAGPRRAVGCPQCLGTGYRGRVLLAELVRIEGPLRTAILQRADLQHIQQLLAGLGHQALADHGRQLVEQGVTGEQELQRAIGSEPL